MITGWPFTGLSTLPSTKPLVAKATLALLEDESLFELVAMESGLEENQYNNYLYRYKATAVPETEDEESESE